MRIRFFMTVPCFETSKSTTQECIELVLTIVGRIRSNVDSADYYLPLFVNKFSL